MTVSSATSRSSSNAGHGGLEAPLGRDLGMQLADPARRRAADDDLPAAAGMQERLGIAGLGDGPRRPDRIEHRAQRRPWRRRSRRRAVRAHARWQVAPDPVSSSADVVGLGRRMAGGRIGRQVDGAGLEQPDRLGAAAAVGPRDVEQRSEQRRPQPRLLGRHRVLQLDRRPLGDPQLPGAVGPLEAPADDLMQALRGERVAGGSPQPLAIGQPPEGAVARGQRRRQRLERPEPRHLLDQVGLAGHVGAPERGHGHVEPVGRIGDAELERGQDLAATLDRNLDAEQARDLGAAQADRLRLGPRAADVDRAGQQTERRRHRSSAASPARARRAPARAPTASRTGSTPPSAARASARCGGCWRRTSWPPPSAPGWWRPTPLTGRRPSRRRSTSVRRRRRSAPSRRPACASGRRASSAARRRSARRTVSSPPATRSRSNACSGLPGQQHHVVGDVDDVRDRPLAGGHQPRLQPRRAIRRS